MSDGTPIELVTNITAQKKFYRIERGAIRSGFTSAWLPHGNDDNGAQVDIGFPVSLGTGGASSQVWVNENGNLTFANPNPTFIPVGGLKDTGYVMIAPFLADVDTRERLRPQDGRLISYGKGWVDGRAAFGVNYIDVTYAREPASNSADATNSFQAVLIDRSDVAAGDFDIEFNYDRVVWESAAMEASGGQNGYGGNPARVGINDRTGKTAELAASGTSMELLDFNPLTQQVPTSSLIYNYRGTIIPGRYRFSVRGGVVQGSIAVNAGTDQTLTVGVTSANLPGSGSVAGGGTPSYQWEIIAQPVGAGAIVQSPSSAMTSLLKSGGGALRSGLYRARLTAWQAGDPQLVARDTVTIIIDGDADGDGVSDSDEDKHGTDRDSGDSDGDGVSDYDEIHRIVNGRPAPTDPLRPDNPAVELVVFGFVAP